jgi:type IV pilus assembly protein PilM
MSFLSNLSNAFSSLASPKSKTKSVLGLDIGSSSLKVVQLRRENGGAVLETYGELALGPYGGVEVGQATNLTADRIGETLHDLLREASVTTTSAGVSIPFSRSLLTLVELPRARTPEEQKTIVELEARKYIPVPVSEVQLDWFIIPDVETQGKGVQSPKVRVLIVAVHNDELTLLQNVTKASGLETDFYEIEIFSTIRSVVDEPVKPVMILDIGASATKVYIVEHGVVALSHNIPQGGQDVTRTISSAHGMSIAEAETLKKEHGFQIPAASYSRETIELVYSRIFEESKRVFTQYETNNQKTVSCIMLTGGGGVTKELGTYAREFFSIDVKIADPFGKTQAPAFMRPVLQDIGPEFAVAVGLALRKLEELG